jgi:hypothetical protein
VPTTLLYNFSSKKPLAGPHGWNPHTRTSYSVQIRTHSIYRSCTDVIMCADVTVRPYDAVWLAPPCAFVASSLQNIPLLPPSVQFVPACACDHCTLLIVYKACAIGWKYSADTVFGGRVPHIYELSLCLSLMLVHTWVLKHCAHMDILRAQSTFQFLRTIVSVQNARTLFLVYKMLLFCRLCVFCAVKVCIQVVFDGRRSSVSLA